MTMWMCTTCGTQHAESERAPDACRICADDRQYVGAGGQQWTTHERLRRSHQNTVRLEDEGLIGIGIAPDFAIGQRALLVRAAGGNVLWDCVSLLDDAVAEMIRGLGGVRAVAISHPHYYANVVDWAHAFGAPVYLHAADREWVMRPDACIVHWDGDALDLGGGMTLLRLGGHFPGGTVLHWPAGGAGAGVLLSGDVVQVAADLKQVSVMYSFPNLIPVSASTVRRMSAALEPFAFERVAGAWWGRVIREDAKIVVRRSLARYAKAVSADDGT